MSSKGITTDNTAHAIEDGDMILRELPGGAIDRFLVVDNGYHGPWGGQKAYYSIKYRKINAIPPEIPQTVIYNLNGANSAQCYGSCSQPPSSVRLGSDRCRILVGLGL